MFSKEKQTFLQKKDKSKQGHIDKHIKPLIELINKDRNYYTTSSCSGRIVLIKKSSEKKQDASWLFVSHKRTTKFYEIWNILKNLPSEDVWFRFEPAILHIACKDLKSSSDMLNIARSIGFKRSGIQSTKKNLLEICGTDYIDTIISRDKDLKVDGDYIKLLVSESNKKMKRNHQKLEKLKKELRSLFTSR